MEEAATIRISTHQIKVEKCEGNSSKQTQITAFSGCDARKYTVVPFMFLLSLNRPSSILD